MVPRGGLSEFKNFNSLTDGGTFIVPAAFQGFPSALSHQPVHLTQFEKVGAGGSSKSPSAWPAGRMSDQPYWGSSHNGGSPLLGSLGQRFEDLLCRLFCFLRSKQTLPSFVCCRVRIGRQGLGTTRCKSLFGPTCRRGRQSEPEERISQALPAAGGIAMQFLTLAVPYAADMPLQTSGRKVQEHKAMNEAAPTSMAPSQHLERIVS